MEANKLLTEQRETLLENHQRSIDIAEREKSKILEKMKNLQDLLEAVAAGEPVVDSEGNDLAQQRDSAITAREQQKHAVMWEEQIASFELVRII